MPSELKLKQKGLLIVAAVCVAFLFLGGPELIRTRSFKHAWDLGHIAAFAVWMLLLLRSWPWLAAAPFGQQATVVLLICLAAGGSVELLQGTLGRYPAWDDMGRNAVGCLLALFFLFPKRLSVDQRWRRLCQGATLVLFFFTLIPVSRALIDEWTAGRQFPVLADFETPFELDRWSGNAGLTVDHRIAHTGRASLRIGLTTAKYSGAELNYFPGNWRNHQAVTFNIYNPDMTPVRIVCKIRDHSHDRSGYRYQDRFNQSYEISPGWNHVEIKLADIEAAPQNRKMDLAHVTGFQVFTVSLPEPRALYLDSLALLQ